MKINISLLFVIILSQGVFAQELEIGLFVSEDSLGLGESSNVVWETQNAQSVYLIPFGKVDKTGETSLSIESNTTLILIAENFDQYKVLSKNIKLSSGTKGLEPGSDTEYLYPIKGKLKNSSLLRFTEKLEEILQNELRFSLFASGLSSNDKIAIKTNLANRESLLTEDDVKNKIDKRRISYLVSFELDGSNKTQINFVVKALIQYKKKIKRDYTREQDEVIYHKELMFLKSLLEN